MRKQNLGGSLASVLLLAAAAGMQTITPAKAAASSNVSPEQRPAATPQPRYRSKVTIYDLATKATHVVYQADQIVEAPNWSRDGSFLLINTGGTLYRLPLNATGEPKLEKIDLGDGGYRCNNDHDLSRDGKMLAFSASTPASRQSQVWLAHADGTGAKLMTPPAPSYFHGWSPDGKWLAFVGQRDSKFELFRVAATGGAEERLTSKGGYDDGPEYSPDGKWIYFNSDRNGGWDIWRMPPDGAGPGDAKAERVTSDELEDWFPHFSPNGKWMLVFSFPKGTKNHNDKMEGVKLRLMKAPGKKLKPASLEVLTTFFGGQGTINVNSWSPGFQQVRVRGLRANPVRESAAIPTGTRCPPTNRLDCAIIEPAEVDPRPFLPCNRKSAELIPFFKTLLDDKFF